MHPVHLLFLGAVLALGWYLRDKFGRWPLAEKPGEAVATQLSPEEETVLKIYRQKRLDAESAAAAKRQKEFEASLAATFQPPG